MASTTVRIQESTHATLRELAAASGRSLQDVLAEAVELYRRKQLLDETNAAYARLRASRRAGRRSSRSDGRGRRHWRTDLPTAEKRPQRGAVPPRRGEVWEVDLDPVHGPEQAGTRPAVVVSADRFNRGQAGLVVLLPMTTRDKGIPLHVAVEPSESGLGRRGWIKPEDIRSVSVERLGRRLGSVPATALAAVDDRLRVLLEV